MPTTLSIWYFLFQRRTRWSSNRACRVRGLKRPAEAARLGHAGKRPAGAIRAGVDNGAAGRLCGAGSASSCLLYTSPSPRDLSTSRMPSSA